MVAGQVSHPACARPAGRVHVPAASLVLRPAASVRDDGTSTSGRPPVEHLRPPKRGSWRPLAYLQPSDQLGSLDQPVPSSSGSALLPRSSELPTAASAGTALAVAAAGSPPGSLLPVQEQGGASLLQLMAAWDQLSARLPPQASEGRSAELILTALKLALAYSPPAASSSSSRGQQAALSRPVARALSLASRLADLAAAGLPIDAEGIAAGILAEVLGSAAHWQPHAVGGASTAAAAAAAGSGGLTLQVVEGRVGPIVAQLVHDIQRARQLPARVELLDDTAASALRELCLSFYDVRATAVEVVARLDALAASDGLPSYQQQVCALEALQMYAPMGHALGLTAVAAQLEDRCFQILFPESYLRTAAWLREQAAANAEVLARCQAALEAAVAAQPRFGELAGGLVVAGRTKSLFSTLKKLLRLGNTAAGGRARAQLYDLMGLRVVVQPRADLPPEEAEALAAQACYLVRDAAFELWQPVAGRCKDYIAAPKSNGYQSLHSTVRVASETVSLGGGGGGEGAISGHATLELQIRTQLMHDRAERGVAAHAAYKGGLDATQALQLKSVTDAVLRRTAAAAAAASHAVEVEAGGGGGGGGTAVSGSDAAAEGLFRHLDQNSDGRISLEELQFALQELGVREAQAQSRAAAELLQLAAADGGEAGDGTIGFEAFMAFQRRVGLLQALSAVDHEQVHVLEQQQQQQQEQQHEQQAGAGPDGGLSSFDGGLSSMGVAGSPWGGSGGAGGSGRRLAAGTCRARGSGGALGWQPQGGGQLGGSRPRGRPRGAHLAARAFLETSSARSSSDSSVDEERGGVGGGSGGRSWVGRGSYNNLVALQDGPGSGAGERAGRRSARAGPPTREASPARAASPAREAPPAPQAPAAAAAAAPAAQGELLRKPDRWAGPAAGTGGETDGAATTGAAAGAGGWGKSRVVQGIMRLVGQAGPPPADATWQLVASPSLPHAVLNAAGGVVPATACGRRQALRIPDLGPCVVGAVFDRDCDYVVDVPTVSGRHVRLEVVRRPDARGGHSKLLLTDLGSTNGTRINRAPIQAHREVTLHPGDVVCLAEGGISFEVQVLAPAPPSPDVAASNGAAASAAAVAVQAGGGGGAGIGSLGGLAGAHRAAATLPAVVAALRLAGALEAAAAAQGSFPPGGAVYADLPDRARRLMAGGSHEAAHALLLAGAMQQPWEGGLWAQLANLERQRARHGGRGGSYGVARAFYAAAAACFGGVTAAGAGGALRAEAERSEGLCRALGSWAQLELSLGHAGSARALFRGGVAAAKRHPVPAAGAAAAARLLFTWAHKEWRGGEAAQAQRLCGEALEVEPGNAHALCLLGSIEAAAGRAGLARRLYGRALAARPGFVTALQSWGRLEASLGHLSRARPLFQQALRQEPSNTHVLQAWGVAEARHGDAGEARRLLRRCTDADPECRAAWHAWARLEEEAGDVGAARQLYRTVLRLRPGSVPALSALGRLERRAGQMQAAHQLLQEALAADPHHAPSVAEMAALLEAQGKPAQAQRMSKRVRRLNASRRAALREVALQRLPAAVRGPPPGPPSPAPPA